MTFKMRTRLVLLNTAVIGTASVLLVVIIYSLVTHQMNMESLGFLQDEFREYSLLYQNDLDDPDELEKEMVDHFTQARMSYPIFCRVYDADGNVVVSVVNTGDVIPSHPKWVEKTLYTDAEIQFRLNSGDPPSHYHCMLGKVTSPTGRTYVFELGLKLNRLQIRTARLRNYLFATIPGIMLISYLCANWLAQKALKPFDQFIQSLRHIRSGSLDQRLPIRQMNDELDQLAEAANAMLEDIEQTFHLIRDFTGDAAHELRTPLTRLTALLENAVTEGAEGKEVQSYLDQAFEQCQHLRRLIDDLMLLARLDSGDVEGTPVEVNLNDLLQDLGEWWQEVGRERGVILKIDASNGIRVNGHPALLRRVLSNLTENAFKHTPVGGLITVAAGRMNGRLELTVSDSGGGIESSELPKLFNRFYRTATAQSERVAGTGLGLNICQKIVHLHGGTIKVESDRGQGTTIRIVIPLERQA